MKQIIAVYERRGRREKLIGFDAYFDGQRIGFYETYPAAQRALDELAYDEAARAGAYLLGRAA
jgi:hypothetical protein